MANCHPKQKIFLLYTSGNRHNSSTALQKNQNMLRYPKKTVSPPGREYNRNGIDAFFPILRGSVTLEDAMKPECVRRTLGMPRSRRFG